MDDSYRKAQDLIFQEMEDRRQLEEKYESDRETRELIAKYEIDVPALMKAWSQLRKADLPMDYESVLARAILTKKEAAAGLESK